MISIRSAVQRTVTYAPPKRHTMRKRRWSDEDVELLRKYLQVDKLSTYEAGRRLDRTPKQIAYACTTFDIKHDNVQEWSATELSELTKATSAGMLPSEIQRTLFPYRTRNSIIGKLHRLTKSSAVC